MSPPVKLLHLSQITEDDLTAAVTRAGEDILANARCTDPMHAFAKRGELPGVRGKAVDFPQRARAWLGEWNAWLRSSKLAPVLATDAFDPTPYDLDDVVGIVTLAAHARVCALHNENIPAKSVGALCNLTRATAKRIGSDPSKLTAGHGMYAGDSRNWTRWLVKPDAKFAQFCLDHEVAFSDEECAYAPMFRVPAAHAPSAPKGRPLVEVFAEQDAAEAAAGRAR